MSSPSSSAPLPPSDPSAVSQVSESEAPPPSSGPGEHAGAWPSSAPPAPPYRGSALWRFGGLVQTIRPHQWVKNVFVLAPVFFAKDFFEPRLALRAAGAFGVFCLLAGAVYTMNDLVDAEADRRHPVKRYRPIASGRITETEAKVLAATLVLLGLAGAAYGPVSFLVVAFVYFAQNVAYSFKLKHIAYLDVSLIAAGFVLRVMGGGYGTRIHVSNYLLACTALLALFLGFGKRRHELTSAGRSVSKQRAALEGYSRGGLDVALAVTAIATIGTYLAYTLDPQTRAFFQSDSLWLTTAFVVLAVLRFLHLIRSRPKSESPTQEMLKDGPFVGVVLLWVMVVIWIVYNLRPG